MRKVHYMVPFLSRYHPSPPDSLELSIVTTQSIASVRNLYKWFVNEQKVNMSRNIADHQEFEAKSTPDTSLMSPSQFERLLRPGSLCLLFFRASCVKLQPPTSTERWSQGLPPPSTAQCTQPQTALQTNSLQGHLRVGIQQQDVLNPPLKIALSLPLVTPI